MANLQNLVVEAPDFDRIKRGDGRATADGVRLLWYVLNNEILSRTQTVRAASTRRIGYVYEIAPGSQQNNMFVDPETFIVNFTGSTDFTITGIANPDDGRNIHFVNTGTAIVTFAHQSASSVTSNRFVNALGVNINLRPNDSTMYRYQGTDSRWYESRVMGLQRTLNSDEAQVGNVGGGEDNLWSYTLPAARLAVDGDSLDILVAGETAANANGKRIRLYFGSTVLLDTENQTSSNDSDWAVTAQVIRDSATAQKATAEWHSGGMATSNGFVYTTPGETLSGTVAIRATGVSAASATDDIVKELATVDFFPAA